MQNFEQNSYTCSPLRKGSIPESDEESLYSQSAGKQEGFVFVTSAQEHFDNLRGKINVHRPNQVRGHMLILSEKVHIQAVDYVEL